MKNRTVVIRSICLLFPVFLVLAGSSIALAQTNWIKDPNNPVLELGASGAWDDQLVGLPSVVFDGTTYHLWYAGFDGTNGRIGYATSSDGISWTKHTGNPVIDLGSDGSWEDSWVYFPMVVFDGSIFHMWYTGNNGGTPSPFRERIGYATSFDGVSWMKHTGNPVLDVGSAGSWEDEAVVTCFVRYDGTSYRMWYTGYDGTLMQIGYATSSNGTSWTKHTNNPIVEVGVSSSWEYPRVQDPKIVYDGTEYHMWYSGGDFFTWRIGYATSSDGITWTKYTGNPVLNVGDAGSWEDVCVELGAVLYDGTEYHMWYFGGESSLRGQIGYATSSGPNAIDDHLRLIPSAFELHQNYPNPFNPTATIRYELPHASNVSLFVYDILGREVARLVDIYMEPGVHQAQWGGREASGQEVPSGIYIARMVTPEYSKSIKMVLLK